MQELVRFNSRVYVFILSDQGRIMGMKEHWHGVDLNKLPGGGQNLGEGMLECLDREIREEFSLWTPLEYHHLYTPTHCFSSRFRPEEQLILNYFHTGEHTSERAWELNPAEGENLLGIEWLPLEPESAQWFTLETDRNAFLALLKKLGH